jgi:hypothetical protein
MRHRRENEAGEKRGRRVNSRFVIGLLGIIAVAGATGIVISLGQRARPALTGPTPTPALVPRSITPSPIPSGPEAGLGFSLADDRATHEIVLFGGVGDYTSTWLWNGAGWTLAHPPESPAGRFGASAAYDPQTRSVMLFGGRLELGLPVHDTWAWNGTTWGPLDSGAGGPPPGEGSDMAWDPAVNQMVLLTRSGVISSPAATWIWAGNHWMKPPGGALPAGANYSPMGFDPLTNSLLAVGCCVGPPPATGAANTTWRWNGANWTLLPTSVNAPIDGSTMALYPAGGRLVLCACDSPASADLSAWQGGQWDPLPGSRVPVAGGVEITDYDHDQLLLLASGPAQPPIGQAPVELWRWTGSTWSLLHQAA